MPPRRSRADTDAALQAQDEVRNADGSVTLSNPVLECVKLYNQVNVQTGFLPSSCGYAPPIRTWRPIR